jgi:1,4-dihydroxy-2-naphthoyl-CoA hydrolase
MSIWNLQVTPEILNNFTTNSMVGHLGIQFIDVGKDFIKASMPVDQRTIQPAGILHGGASVALAETLGSVAANLCVDPNEKVCVGMEINANHVKTAKTGTVIGTVKPVHLGSLTQIWETRIQDEEGRLICVSRITLAVLDKQN